MSLNYLNLPSLSSHRTWLWRHSDWRQPKWSTSPLIVESLLWERDETGSAVAATIDLAGQLHTALESEVQVAALLSEYGLNEAPGTANSPLSNLSLSLGVGETGSWDGQTYTPDWNVAFSDDDVIFQLTFDAVDPLDPSYVLTGLTAEVFLHFDRSGIDLGLIQSQPGNTEAISVSSENGVGILLAFGTDRQVAIGQEGKLVNINLPVQGLSVPFSQEKLDQLLSIQNGGEFNGAPLIEITNVNTFTEDSDSHGVGSVVASFTTTDQGGDIVTVILSNTTHYSLGTGDNEGNVLLTQAGLDLLNAGGPLPTFQLTPSDGSSGLPKSITPLVNVVNDSPTGSVTISGNLTQGSTLSAVTNALSDEDGLGTFSYQWRSFNQNSEEFEDIQGANSGTF